MAIAHSFHYGVQGDWENRKWYIAQMIDSYNNDISFESRIGWSPYLVDYDGLSTWIILQNMNGQIKPILRFFKDNFLIEYGSRNGAYFLTLMMHF